MVKKVEIKDDEPIVKRVAKKISETAKAENAEEPKEKVSLKAKEEDAPKVEKEPLEAPKDADNASIGEEVKTAEKEAKIEPKAEAKKPTQEKAKPTKKKAKKAKAKKDKKEAKSKLIEEVGKKSKEIEALDSNKKTKEEEEYDLFKELLTAQKSRQLLWGTVYGVEPSKQFGGVIIAVLWNGIKISIPDKEYFEPSFEFGTRYEQATPEEKIKRRQIMASYQYGARVCFLVKAVVQNPITYGEHEGQKEIMCVASRKEAMSLIRDIYFYHRERKNPLSSDSEVKINDTYEANVIAVKEDYVLVECLGVETRIPPRELAEGYIENCKDVVSPGDKITVKIKRMHINGGDNVYLTVTGKLNDTSKMINSMQEKSSYLGVVESVNRAKKIYNIRLKNGVLANVLEDNIQGGVPLFVGNKVAVKVSRILDDRVYGNVIKL